jgi:hypothetical protein
VLLKIGRLSSQDLADCLALLEKARAEALTLDAERLVSAVDSLPSSQDVALRERRARLREALASARV